MRGNKSLIEASKEDCRSCLWPFLIRDGAHGAPTLPQGKPEEDCRAYLWPFLVGDGAYGAANLHRSKQEDTQGCLWVLCSPPSRTATEQRPLNDRPGLLIGLPSTQESPLNDGRRGLKSPS